VPGRRDLRSTLVGAKRPRAAGALGRRPRKDVDQPGVQLARQQVAPVLESTTAVLPAGAPPFTTHLAASDLIVQRSTTGGHVELSVQRVVPSSHVPVVEPSGMVHVPGLQIVHVTKPSFLPQVERAAQRVTLPLQFTSSSLFLTASLAARATQLTYCPWFPVHGPFPFEDALWQLARIASRTVGRRGSLHPAFATDAMNAAIPATATARATFLMGQPSFSASW
jgi:hypothetical protein